MTDINPFLGENYQELVAKRGNDSTAMEDSVEAQAEMSHYQSSSAEADLGLKTVIEEEDAHRVASYKAALQHFPVKRARVDPLPVFDPESLKDHRHAGVAYSSTSQASSYGAQQVGSNKASTSDEEEHLREDSSLRVPDEDDQPNEMFQLCFVAPKSISDCRGFVRYEVTSILLLCYHRDFSWI